MSTELGLHWILSAEERAKQKKSNTKAAMRVWLSCAFYVQLEKLLCGARAREWKMWISVYTHIWSPTRCFVYKTSMQKVKIHNGNATKAGEREIERKKHSATTIAWNSGSRFSQTMCKTSLTSQTPPRPSSSSSFTIFCAMCTAHTYQTTKKQQQQQYIQNFHCISTEASSNAASLFFASAFRQLMPHRNRAFAKA